MKVVLEEMEDEAVQRDLKTDRWLCVSCFRSSTTTGVLLDSLEFHTTKCDKIFTSIATLTTRAYLHMNNITPSQNFERMKIKEKFNFVTVDEENTIYFFPIYKEFFYFRMDVDGFEAHFHAPLQYSANDNCN